MPATRWPLSGNHATVTLMPIFLLYSRLCCAHDCVYTYAVHTDCSFLTDRSIASIQGTPHTHHTHTHRHSQMLSSSSPTNNTQCIPCYQSKLVSTCKMWEIIPSIDCQIVAYNHNGTFWPLLYIFYSQNKQIIATLGSILDSQLS